MQNYQSCKEDCAGAVDYYQFCLSAFQILPTFHLVFLFQPIHILCHAQGHMTISLQTKFEFHFFIIKRMNFYLYKLNHGHS